MIKYVDSPNAIIGKRLAHDVRSPFTNCVIAKKGQTISKDTISLFLFEYVDQVVVDEELVCWGEPKVVTKETKVKKQQLVIARNKAYTLHGVSMKELMECLR